MKAKCLAVALLFVVAGHARAQADELRLQLRGTG